MRRSDACVAKTRCHAVGLTTPCSEPSGDKATVLRPWVALTNASRAAGGIHDVIVWQSPPATDVAPTKRLITKSRVQGCRASGRDASTPGGNHQHVGNAQATRYGLLLGLTRVCHCKRAGWRRLPRHEPALPGYAIGTGMLHSAYTAQGELQNHHAVAQVSLCQPVLSTSRRLFAPTLITFVRVIFV